MLSRHLIALLRRRSYPNSSISLRTFNRMPHIHAISRTRHAQQHWQRPAHYAFAASEAVAVLTAQELPKAMMSLPIAFFATKGRFVPVAVQGFQPGKNLFVARDGRWLGGYIPSAYRAFPFVLGKGADGQQVLCINEESGLLPMPPVGVAASGEAFFGEDDQLSPTVAETLSFLNQIASQRLATEAICALLQQHALVQPWLITVQSEAGEQAVKGLYRIDEAALNQLPTEAFMALRQAGALPVIYCQLLSMQHLPLLGKLAHAHTQQAQAAAAPVLPPSGELNLDFLSNNGTISFGNLFK